MAPPETSQGAPRPCCGITPAEQLLTAGLQGWANARVAGQAPQEALGPALAAETSARVASLFVAWVQAIEATSLRPLRTRCGHCGGVSADLQRLVAACGVAPVAFLEGERLIAPLVSEPRTVMILARSLNGALAQAGWPLPARRAERKVEHPHQPNTLH